MAYTKFPLFFVALCYMAFSGVAFACPRIDGLVDYNCNGAIKFALTGDSIVYGTGDDEDDTSSLGYVGRLRELLPEAKVTNLGVRGITSYRLLRAYKKLLTKPGPGRTKTKTADADVIVIDVGRNDYWGHRNAALTATNIRRLAKYLKTHVGADIQASPLVVVSTLLPTTRAYQQPFIEEVNRLIIRNAKADYRVGPRFDIIDESLLNDDGLHPSAEGYDAMAKLAYNYMTGPLQSRLRGRMRDRDGDGLPDYFEVRRYFTDRSLPDTDGDGYLDGAEVLQLMSNPLDPLSPGA